MSLLFTYLSFALGVSFLCSVLEAVVLSIPLSYITLRIEEKSPLSKDLIRLRDDIDQPISAILTLNTFAHTLGAAGVGAQAQIIWGETYLTLISVVLTLLILFISEIIPKTLGASYWRELTPFALRITRWLVYLLYPVVLTSQLITNLLKKKKVDSIFTRSDLRKLAGVIQKEGLLDLHESRIIQNLMLFKKIPVRKIMTPRTVMLVRDENMTVEEFYEQIESIPFSRIPIYNNHIDGISGFVLKDDVLKAMADNRGHQKLADIARKIHLVSAEMNALAVLNELISNKAHISLVVDDYGGTEGVLTIEDVVESLLGMEIVDETDSVRNMRTVARQRWVERRKRTGEKYRKGGATGQKPPPE